MFWIVIFPFKGKVMILRRFEIFQTLIGILAVNIFVILK